MRQCPDCEAKDRVVIASKVFCANCGTPWQPADPKELEAYNQASAPPPPQPAPPTAPEQSSAEQSPPNSDKPDNNATPSSPPDKPEAIKPVEPEQQSSPTPAPVAPAPEPVTPATIGSPLDSNLTNSPVSQTSNPPTNSTQTTEQAEPASTNDTPPNPTKQVDPAPRPDVGQSASSTPSTAGNPPPAAIAPRTTADRLAAAQGIDKSASINKFHQPIAQISSRQTASPTTPPSTAAAAQVTAAKTSDVQSAPPAPAETPASVPFKIDLAKPQAEIKPIKNNSAAAVRNEELSEHVGAELSDINRKDNNVLSDNQFNEFQKLNDQEPETKPPTDYINNDPEPAPTDVKPTEPAQPTAPPAAVAVPPATPTSTPPAATKQAEPPPPTAPPLPAALPQPTPTSTPSTAPSTVKASPVDTASGKRLTDVSRAPKSDQTNSPLSELANGAAPITHLPSAEHPPTKPTDGLFKPAGSAAAVAHNFSAQPSAPSTRPANTSDVVAAATPTPAPTDTTTVAGLTMSKEAAMKLALDSDTSNKPTGEASIGKAFKPSSVALTVVGVLLVGAYIWQVNYPNLALKVAGNRANLAIGLPSYLPSGWKLSGPIQSRPGQVSYNLANEKKDRELSVSATKTDWDSQALADNYVGSKSDSYLALQSQGLTVYIYGDNQASWVNGGKWYRLEGDSKGLSQDQIIKMATSL